MKNEKINLQTLSSYWYSRSDKQRYLLLLTGIVLIGLIAIFAIVLPLQNKIRTLNAEIPALEQSLLQMRAQSQSKPATKAGNSADLRSTLFEILARENISTDLRALSNGRIELRLPTLAFKEALSLAQTLRAESNAQIMALQITFDQNDQTSQFVIEMGRKE